jgi:hypothetical protein
MAVRLLVLCAAPLHSLHAQSDSSQLRPATEARALAPFRDTSLDEVSGIAASRQHPGILWLIDDSGADATLHATDTTGANLGTWTVRGAENRDWEAIALGPCPTGDCLYIGDIGDNRSHHSFVTVYRIPEPDPSAPDRVTPAATTLRLTYPGGSRDAEALAVLPDTTLLVISKSMRGSAAYTVPVDAWRRTGPVQATSQGALSIPAGSLATLVTDAAVAPDGVRIAVRTYTAIYFFRIGSHHALTPDPTTIPCGIFGIEAQGEGITWIDPKTMITASESNFGFPGGLALVRCGR